MAVSSKTAPDSVRPGLSTEGPGPIRTCIGCRKRAAAAVLLRVVADSESNVVVPDPQHRASGRGAWLHDDVGCLDLAERRRAFGRALRVTGQLDPTAVREYVTGTAASTSTANRQEHPTSGTPQE